MVELRMTRARALAMQRRETIPEIAADLGMSRTNLNLLMLGKHGARRQTCEAVSRRLGWEGDPMRVFEDVRLVECGC